MVSKIVEKQQVVEVLEEEADLLKFPDQQSVKDVEIGLLSRLPR